MEIDRDQGTEIAAGERGCARVIAAVADLATDPHPPGSKKLVGSEHTYRIRQGDYRVVYDVLAKELVVEVIRVRHRRDAYR